ncbi:hypothetical protein J6590_002026 [Homalodisca vitripennis]|nr:hypothetical protein J6590_002026 [Homalodisca vitripennis]
MWGWGRSTSRRLCGPGPTDRQRHRVISHRAAAPIDDRVTGKDLLSEVTASAVELYRAEIRYSGCAAIRCPCCEFVRCALVLPLKMSRILRRFKVGQE